MEIFQLLRNMQQLIPYMEEDSSKHDDRSTNQFRCASEERREVMEVNKDVLTALVSVFVNDCLVMPLLLVNKACHGAPQYGSFDVVMKAVVFGRIKKMEAVHRDVLDLLKLNPDGIHLKKLAVTYSQRYKRNLTVSTLGFPSLTAFIESMKDELHLEGELILLGADHRPKNRDPTPAAAVKPKPPMAAAAVTKQPSPQPADTSGAREAKTEEPTAEANNGSAPESHLGNKCHAGYEKLMCKQHPRNPQESFCKFIASV
ncbi:Mediator of RNA polymerase II transcription subunit 30 [Acipenser ruthenus]|uniref:Mediator of RNA polymerase II transcription subunit 30 n=1 Tax=Acipenser ruthenus TaxID=7906 RepID=A0A444UJ32_ACIRT|nr:Mediator of RNA polymerase II transcription subunit 30 [Acipenser ruthenus]